MGARHVVCADLGRQEGDWIRLYPAPHTDPAMAWLSLRVLQHIRARFAAWFVLWALCRGLVVF